MSQTLKYTPELLKELRFEAKEFHCNIPGTIKEFVADYALLGNENAYINYNNQIVDLIDNTRLSIIFAIGAMVEKVAASPDGEAKQFWAKEIGKINSSVGNLEIIARHFCESENIIRRMGKEYFDLLQGARRDQQELNGLKKLMKEQEELNK